MGAPVAPGDAAWLVQPAVGAEETPATRWRGFRVSRVLLPEALVVGEANEESVGENAGQFAGAGVANVVGVLGVAGFHHGRGAGFGVGARYGQYVLELPGDR